jgi:hypothetical protein
MPAQIFKVAYDFSNAECSIDVVELQGTQIVVLSSLPIADGIEEVNYTPSIEREKMYGSNRQPQARTEGQADYEASITMQLYWWRYLIDVANDLGRGLGNIELNIGYNLFKGGNVPLHQDVIWRAAIKSPESAFKRGPENMMVPVSLDPMNIFYDGVDMFGNPIA